MLGLTQRRDVNKSNQNAPEHLGEIARSVKTQCRQKDDQDWPGNELATMVGPRVRNRLVQLVLRVARLVTRSQRPRRADQMPPYVSGTEPGAGAGAAGVSVVRPRFLVTVATIQQPRLL